MARKGNLDKGLYSETRPNGKVVWFVRVYHNYQARKFGSFKTKTEAQMCYRQARLLIQSGLFRPESFYKRKHNLTESKQAHVPKPITRVSGVYFVQCQQTKYIKIGYSSNIRRRVANLQIANPGTLQFVGWLPGERELETNFHQRFSHHRARGEWFKPEPDLCIFLTSLGLTVL